MEGVDGLIEIEVIMADISNYFRLDATLYPGSGLTFFVFDDSQKNSFINDCLLPFREAYISESKLTAIVNDYQTKREDEIKAQLPDKGEVMSGDFGEILSFYLACQLWSPTVNVFPMKWRFKDKKKAPSHYTDIMLFELQDPSNPSAASINDTMYSYEVKTRATKLGNQPYKTHVRKAFKTYKDGRPESTILEAVFYANKDAVERAAETIPYLELRCKEEGYKELYHQVHRFSDAVTTTYRKEHNAVAIVDSDMLTEQMSRMPGDLIAQHPNVKNVYCLPIKELKALYEKVYDDMPLKA